MCETSRSSILKDCPNNASRVHWYECSPRTIGLVLENFAAESTMPLFIPLVYHPPAHCWQSPQTNPRSTFSISHTLYTNHTMNGRTLKDNTAHLPACLQMVAARRATTKNGAFWGKYPCFPGFSPTSTPSRPSLSRWEMSHRLD